MSIERFTSRDNSPNWRTAPVEINPFAPNPEDGTWKRREKEEPRRMPKRVPEPA
jgi:hypothetical protein